MNKYLFIIFYMIFGVHYLGAMKTPVRDDSDEKDSSSRAAMVELLKLTPKRAELSGVSGARNGTSPTQEQCGELVELLTPDKRRGTVVMFPQSGANNSAVFACSSTDPDEKDSVIKYSNKSISPTSLTRHAECVNAFTVVMIPRDNGTESPAAVATKQIVTAPCGGYVEIMDAAQGQSLLKILETTSLDNVDVVNKAYIRAGELFARVHTAKMKDCNTDDVRTIKTYNSHSDAHSNNVMYCHMRDSIRFIDLERSVFALENPVSPFFDVMTFVMMPILGWRKITNNVDFIKKMASAYSMFLTTYAHEYRKHGIDICDYLTKLFDQWFNTAYALATPYVTEGRVTAKINFDTVAREQFFRSSVYTGLGLGMFYLGRGYTAHDYIYQIWKPYMVYVDSIARDENSLHILKMKLRYMQRYMLAAIRGYELSENFEGFDLPAEQVVEELQIEELSIHMPVRREQAFVKQSAARKEKVISKGCCK